MYFKAQDRLEIMNRSDFFVSFENEIFASPNNNSWTLPRLCQKYVSILIQKGPAS